MDALKKSKEMIRGNWWKTFGIVVIAGIFSIIISSLISSISAGNAFVSGLLMAIYTGIISVYFGYVVVAYYFSLKK